MKRLNKFICVMLFAGLCIGTACLSGCKDEVVKNELNITFDFELNKPVPNGNGKDVKVVILAGQSNATGIAHTEILEDKVSPEKYNEYVNGYDNVYINYNMENGRVKSDGFVKTNVESDVWFGPEIGLAEALSKSDDTYFIVKYSYGGTTLSEHWNKDNECLYKGLVAYVDASIEFLRNNSYNPKIEALLWMQGESDATESRARNYYKNTKKFVASIREEYGNIKFIDAGISDSPYWEEYKKINKAKERFGKQSDNNYYIDTIASGLTYNLEPYDSPDLGHYDSLSQIALGQLFGKYVLE